MCLWWHLQEDPFEESIVDFFETADTDKDGMVDINNFYAVSACMCTIISKLAYNIVSQLHVARVQFMLLVTIHTFIITNSIYHNIIVCVITVCSI